MHRGQEENTNCCQDIFNKSSLERQLGMWKEYKRIGTLTLKKQFFKFRNVHSREVALDKFCGNDYLKPHIDYELMHGDSHSK